MYSNIKYVFIDVDGCLTDGKYHYHDNKSISKSFYTKDFWAIEKCLELGINVVILSGCVDKCTFAKFESFKLQLDKDIKGKIDCSFGTKNKWDYILRLIESRGLNVNQFFYLGDAENDIQCISNIKMSFCPIDSSECIKNVLIDSNRNGQISNKKGGEGFVYETLLKILND